MSRNVFILILLAIIGIGIYFSVNDTDKLKRKHRANIDSIQDINKDLLIKVGKLKKEVISLNMEQEDLEYLADSLAQEASKPIPCEHELNIRKEENKALRGALNKCKEVKAIQVATIKRYDTLLINHEVIVVNHESMHKISKKEKKKAFFKGAGIGGGLGILLALLILL